MPPRSFIRSVEVFHLLVLRAMEARIDRASYVVKGGVNLRAWFGSPRYSQDLDLDAVAGTPHRLRDRFDALLASRVFQTLLASQDLSVLHVSRPKQTETTQRWKFQISSPASELPLPTRVEFSRRGSDKAYELAPARPEVVQVYGLSPPTANHYTAPAAIRQKIGALAGRREPQARDIFDLDHLFRATGADPRPLPPSLRDLLPTAIERAIDTPLEVFRSQVVPFLTSEHQEIFGTAAAWDRMRESVVDRLAGLRA